MEIALEDPYPTEVLATIQQMPVSFYLGYGLALIFLLAASGIVSGSEIAFFSLKSQEDEPTDDRMKRLLDNPRQLLATILVLNNLINVFIVTLSTYATWQMIGSTQSEGMIILALTIVITILIIFFGEILPKVYATNNAIGFAHFSLPAIAFFDQFLRPFSWLLMSVSNIIERRIAKRGYNLSVEEINHALEITSETDVSKEEKGILKGIVNFGTLSVKQIMRSRVDISAIDVKSDFHELMDQINKTGYSRIPVFTENIDKVEGLLYIKDVLPHLHNEEDFEWQALLRPAYFVPESKKIDDLFKGFQEKQVHMAIVVDEYGGTEGLLTMEDIIEEIVGEINDEFDEGSDINYKKIDSKTFVFEGKTSLNDFCKVVEEDADVFDEVKGESESLGGLLLEINRSLPHSGEKIRFGNYLFTVVAVDNKRIKKVRVLIGV